MSAPSAQCIHVQHVSLNLQLATSTLRSTGEHVNGQIQPELAFLHKLYLSIQSRPSRLAHGPRA